MKLYEPIDKNQKTLSIKPVNILITNDCNLYCGGCTQHCDLFGKEEKWYIPLPQLEMNIRALIDPCRSNFCNHIKSPIGIFGGEPTLHPQWFDILDLLYSFEGKAKFMIFTNGSQKDKIKGTLNANYFYVQLDKSSIFNASCLAAKDCYKSLLADKTEEEMRQKCWEIAQKDCYMWTKGPLFFSLIYDNRAYMCEPAGAIDRLILGKKNWSQSRGWPVKIGENCFDKTNKEIASQAVNFCYRCGCCTKRQQPRMYKTIISPTNIDLIGIDSYYNDMNKQNTRIKQLKLQNTKTSKIKNIFL